MSFVVSDDELGTPESAWLGSPHLHRVLRGKLLSLCDDATVGACRASFPKRIVVVAPHPDDEVLGAGGILHRLAYRGGHSIHIIAVTDGEASHPDSITTSREALRLKRDLERTKALLRLGIADRTTVTRLGYPDGEISTQDMSSLVRPLCAYLVGAHYCFAPWHYDGHPDHDATGLAAKMACALTNVPIAHYLVWAWHWANPSSANDIPWASARHVALSNTEVVRKRMAIAAYESQITPLSAERGDEAVLPKAVIARFTRRFEVFLT